MMHRKMVAKVGGLGFIAFLVTQAQTPTEGVSPLRQGAPAATPRFEVTEVHRSGSATNPYTWASGGVMQGARYDVRKATMVDLIRIAYDVEPDLIFGGPNWLAFDRFDVAGKADPATPLATARMMLQALLAERFHLVVHRDVKPMPALALSVGKTKPKLVAADGGGVSSCNFVREDLSSTELNLVCRKTTMDALVARLRMVGGDYVTGAVVNATGLEGEWDFNLRWHRRAAAVPAGARRVTIFEAVEQQLGLALMAGNVPTPVMVVDRVDENPTPDAPDAAQKMPAREVQYEVADLKINKSGELTDGWRTAPDGTFDARNVRLPILMASAWDLETAYAEEHLANLPKWTHDMRVDVHAKPAGHGNAPIPAGVDPGNDDARLMLRNLLTERFQIRSHVESRPQNAYTLVAKKPKMAKANAANRASCGEAKILTTAPEMNPLLTRVIRCQNVTMAQFAAALHGLARDYIVDTEVEDATGLAGRYDFTLSFSDRRAAAAAAAAGPGEAADPSGAISLPDAISQQLGLRLEMRKRMLPMVVIDHMEETPLGN